MNESLSEVGKQQRVAGFVVELESILKHYGLCMRGDYDGDLHLAETDTGVEIAWLESKDAGTYEINYDQEAIDPEGYAMEQDQTQVPVPADRPADYHVIRIGELPPQYLVAPGTATPKQRAAAEEWRRRALHTGGTPDPKEYRP